VVATALAAIAPALGAQPVSFFANLSTSQELDNLAYINFHTMQNPGGEVRGQINVVPEPATVLLLGSGLLGLGGLAWRRRKCRSAA